MCVEGTGRGRPQCASSGPPRRAGKALAPSRPRRRRGRERGRCAGGEPLAWGRGAGCGARASGRVARPNAGSGARSPAPVSPPLALEPQAAGGRGAGLPRRSRDWVPRCPAPGVLGGSAFAPQPPLKYGHGSGVGAVTAGPPPPETHCGKAQY